MANSAPKDLVYKLLSLLEIESFTYHEEKLVGFLEQACSEIVHFQRTKIGNTLIFQEPNPEHKPLIALFGHLDTVPNQQDEKPHLKDGKIYGCGASDMKGGLAVMLELLLKADRTESRPKALAFVFYDGEEGDYSKNGLDKAFDAHLHQLKADLALVLEPTLNSIQSGCLGSIHLECRVKGKSGHSARPWEADNAILKALPVLQRLQKATPVEHKSMGLVFFETISPTLFHAGLVRNVIPGEALISLNYRFPPNKSLAEAEAYLAQFFFDLDLELRIIDRAPSAKVVLDNPLLKTMIDTYQLKLLPKQAWTDIARLGLWGLDAVNFGPGDPSQAHQKNEHIAQQKLEECYQILLQFLFQR